MSVTCAAATPATHLDATNIDGYLDSTCVKGQSIDEEDLLQLATVCDESPECLPAIQTKLSAWLGVDKTNAGLSTTELIQACFFLSNLKAYGSELEMFAEQVAMSHGSGTFAAQADGDAILRACESAQTSGAFDLPPVDGNSESADSSRSPGSFTSGTVVHAVCCYIDETKHDLLSCAPADALFLSWTIGLKFNCIDILFEVLNCYASLMKCLAPMIANLFAAKERIPVGQRPEVAKWLVACYVGLACRRHPKEGPSENAASSSPGPYERLVVLRDGAESSASPFKIIDAFRSDVDSFGRGHSASYINHFVSSLVVDEVWTNDLFDASVPFVSYTNKTGNIAHGALSDPVSFLASVGYTTGQCRSTTIPVDLVFGDDCLARMLRHDAVAQMIINIRTYDWNHDECWRVYTDPEDSRARSLRAAIATHIALQRLRGQRSVFCANDSLPVSAIDVIPAGTPLPPLPSDGSASLAVGALGYVSTLSLAIDTQANALLNRTGEPHNCLTLLWTSGLHRLAMATAKGMSLTSDRAMETESRDVVHDVACFHQALHIARLIATNKASLNPNDEERRQGDEHRIDINVTLVSIEDILARATVDWLAYCLTDDSMSRVVTTETLVTVFKEAFDGASPDDWKVIFNPHMAGSNRPLPIERYDTAFCVLAAAFDNEEQLQDIAQIVRSLVVSTTATATVGSKKRKHEAESSGASPEAMDNAESPQTEEEEEAQQQPEPLRQKRRISGSADADPDTDKAKHGEESQEDLPPTKDDGNGDDTAVPMVLADPGQA
ncbi:hypothetical protein [Mollivirus kamchatka]|nr:hypothetical protein [Mollivirus kamchatka]